MTHIIVSSHRRSGTHYLTDTIVNNFGYKRATVDLDCMKDMSERDLKTFKEECSGDTPIVFWTHAQSPEDIYKNIPNIECSNYVKNKLSEMKTLYIYRDGRDVLTSYWHMKNPDHSLATFISYTAPTWKENIRNWMDKDLFKLKFESLREDYINTVKSISRYIGKEHTCPIVNVTLKSEADRKENVLYSDREFRKGIVGDYQNHFGIEESNVYDRLCSDLTKELGYA
jgi:hypothetical protein